MLQPSNTLSRLDSLRISPNVETKEEEEEEEKEERWKNEHNNTSETPLVPLDTPHSEPFL